MTRQTTLAQLRDARLPHRRVALATAFEMNRVCEAGARQPLSIRYETLWPK
jgi:hypothetical protein